LLLLSRAEDKVSNDRACVALAGTCHTTAAVYAAAGGSNGCRLFDRAQASFISSPTTVKYGKAVGEEGVAAGVKALSQQMWPRLETLTLDCCNVAPAGAAVLATGRWLPALRRLALEDNTLGDAGIMALACGTWPRLEGLSLSDSDRSANVETRPSMRVLVEAAQ